MLEVFDGTCFLGRNGGWGGMENRVRHHLQQRMRADGCSASPQTTTLSQFARFRV